MLKKILLVSLLALIVGCTHRSTLYARTQPTVNHLNTAQKQDNSNFSKSEPNKPKINLTNCQLPDALPNEESEFYGDCKDGKAVKGLVLWKEQGEGAYFDCIIEGENYYIRHLNREDYMTTADIAKEKVCGAYFSLLPSFCQTDNYIGQCKNGKPDGVGIKTLDRTNIDTWNYNYESLNGHFSNGVPDGYVIKTRQGLNNKNERLHLYMSGYASWYKNCQAFVNCDDFSIEKCRVKYKSEPARLVKVKQEEHKYEIMLQKFRKGIVIGTDTSNGVVVDTKGSLIKIQTDESQCTQRDYKDNCVNYVNTPSEKWFKRSEVYPK